MGVYTLCNKAAVSYETYRSIRMNKNKDDCARCSYCCARACAAQEFSAGPGFAGEEPGTGCG